MFIIGDWLGFVVFSRFVFDVDVLNLICLVRFVFVGVMLIKEVFEVESRLWVVSIMNFYYRFKLEVRRLVRKLIVGSEVFFI